MGRVVRLLSVEPALHLELTAEPVHELAQKALDEFVGSPPGDPVLRGARLPEFGPLATLNPTSGHLLDSRQWRSRQERRRIAPAENERVVRW